MPTVPDLLVKLRMAPDTVERHDVVARLAGSPATLLDVGGVRGQLAPFLKDTRIESVNVSGDADVRFDGVRLPYEDRSFDVVTSLDVLEHIPAPRRGGHVAELARVARDRVVLCCPLGTSEHTLAERELSDWHVGVTGAEHPFLAEHLERGLPTAAELRELAGAAEGYTARLRFHGDFRVSNDAFRAGVLARRRPTPRRLARYARARTRRPDGALHEQPRPETNRAYLVLDRS